MSEFTDGILFLKPHLAEVETVAQGLSQPYILHEVNQKWAGLFAENSNIAQPALKNWLLTLSKQVPLFYFQHPADHGWGYNLYRDGKEVASLWVSYELSYHMARNLAHQRYPSIRDVHIELPHGIFGSLIKEIESSETYRNAVKQQYANTNISEFAAFEIAPEVIRELEKIVSAGWYLEDDNHRSEQVVLFKKNLNINEVSWISYRYLLQNRN